MFDFWKVILWSLVSLVVLFLMSKLMGNKQISQLSAFDYITGISIGSIAAELASCQDIDKPLNNVLAIIVYGVAAYLISYITTKNVSLRKIITGRPIVVMDNGQLYRKNLQKARIDMSDFLSMCRAKGYFDINQIETAMIEHNGKLSILPKSRYRPATPEDMNIAVQPEGIITVVVLDGHILSNNLKITGHDVKWLEAKLKKLGLEAQNILVAFCDDNDNVSAYKINDSKVEVDWFE